MAAYYNREDLERLIRKDIQKDIREVIIDVLEYLDLKGFEITRNIIRINKADFILLSSDNLEYEYEYNGMKNTIRINKKEISGFYKPIIVYDDKKEKFVLCKELVVVKVREGEKDIRGKIMHELLHLLSSKQEIKEANKESYHLSGVSRYIYVIENSDVVIKYYDGETCINEAITEVLRYNLMKEIYNKPYELSYIVTKDNKRMYKFNAYYLITNLMNILNLCVTKGTSTDKLLNIYLNNEREEFYMLLEKNFDMDKNMARDLFFEFRNLMVNIFKYNMSDGDLKILMKTDVLPIYERILFKFYKNLQSKKYSKDELQTLSLYLDEVENYISIYFSYPILSAIKESLLYFLCSVRKTYV